MCKAKKRKRKNSGQAGTLKKKGVQREPRKIKMGRSEDEPLKKKRTVFWRREKEKDTTAAGIRQSVIKGARTEKKRSARPDRKKSGA